MKAYPPRRFAACHRVLPAALGALLAACVGCTPPVPQEARQLLVDSRAAYDRGDDVGVVRDTSAFLTQHARTKLAEVAYYLRGLSRYRQRDTAAAKADFKAAASRAERKDVRVGSLKALGDLAYEEGDMDWADSLYEQVLGEMDPRAKPAGEVRYRLGCVFQRNGRWAKADQQFDRVLHVFAGTEVARQAERKVRCRAWTIQAGAFGRQALADAEAGRLRAGSLPARMRAAAGGGKLRFLVQVGWYDSYAGAAAAFPAVRRLRRDAFITPTR